MAFTPERILQEMAKGAVDPNQLKFFIQNPAFAERPVPIEQFIMDPEYLHCPETWPEIREILKDLFQGAENGKRFSPYREFVFDAGIGSGKSFIVSCVFCYVVYWLLCIDNPQKFYGLAPRSVICLINTSTTSNQARRVVFGQVKARIDLSPWFQNKYPPNARVRSELRFPKDIVIFPGSSSETAPIGYSIMAANVDEASWFDETDIKSAASEVFDVLDRRIDSRFGDKGLMAVTSSPRYVDDFTEKKFEESIRNKRILGVRKATWETRPDDIELIKNGDSFELSVNESSEKIKIPNKYENAFRKNPAKAWRDFGAKASLALEPFFEQAELALLEKAVKESILPPSTVNGVLNPELNPIPGIGYRIHIDLGIVRDCCGFAMAHPVNGMEGVTIDLLLRIASARRASELRDKDEPVDMIIGTDQVDLGGFHPEPYGVLGIIADLSSRGFLIERVTFDNFQSVHSRQELERNGFLAELLSVDKDTSAYDTLKTIIRSAKFQCPPHLWFLHEGKRLELVKGKKVDHPPKGSKDVMDAGAGAVKSVREQFDVDDEEGETIVDEDIRIDIEREF